MPASRMTYARYRRPLVAVLVLALLAVLVTPQPASAVTSLRVTAPMLLFTQGETQIPLESDAAEADWTISDEAGVPVRSGRTALSGGKGVIDLRTIGLGFYRLAVRADSGSGAKTVNTSFAVLTPLPAEALDPASPFAVQTHFSDGWGPDLLPTVQKVGFARIRDGAYWNWVEQTKGVYNFSRFDTYVAKAHDLGITPMIFAGFRNPLYEGGRTPATPEGQAAFAAYTSELSRHYSYATQDVEIYNEFNWSYFNNSTCGFTGACYFPLLKANYQRVKADNPNAFVVGGATAGLPLEWFEELFSLGGLQYMDAVSAHPYRYPAPPEGLEDEIAALRQLMRQYNNGVEKPIRLSELGWPTHTGGGTSESQQADYLVRAYMLAIGAGVQQLYWYDFRNDGEDPTYNEHNFGLVRRHNADVASAAPKPAAVAAAVMMRQLAGLRFDGNDGLAKPAYSYRFGTGAATTRVLWATEPKTVQLSTSDPLTVTDQFGRSATYVPVGGKVSLAIDVHPLFVRGKVTQLRVTSGSPYSVVAPAKVATGDEVPVTLQVDRRDHAGDGSASGQPTFHIAGQAYRVPAPPGVLTQKVVSIPASTVTGPRTLVADVGVGAVRSARLVASLQTVEPVEVVVSPVINSRQPFQGELAMSITNNRLAASVQVDGIDWKLGSEQGVVDNVDAVPARSTKTTTVAVPGAEPWASYQSSVTVRTSDGQLRADGPTGFNPVEPLGSATVAPLDLSRYGKPVYRARPYGGAEDLSGSVRLAYTDAALTITADITDNAFSQTHTAPEMWQGDSIQFAVTPALPGRSSQMVEIGAAQLPSGPAVYSFRPPPGQDAGATPGSALTVTRDGSVTHYRITVPWTSLGFDGLPKGPFGLSLLVNDDDGAGRAGWVEWGGGIGGTKQPSLLRPVQLVN